MRERYAAEQNITIAGDGCCTEIPLRLNVTFTADASESAKTVEITRIVFFKADNGVRGEQVELPDWFHDRYLSSPDFKEWLQSVSVEIEDRAAEDAKLVEEMS